MQQEVTVEWPHSNTVSSWSCDTVTQNSWRQLRYFKNFSACNPLITVCPSMGTLKIGTDFYIPQTPQTMGTLVPNFRVWVPQKEWQAHLSQLCLRWGPTMSTFENPWSGQSQWRKEEEVSDLSIFSTRCWSCLFSSSSTMFFCLRRSIWLPWVST